MSTAAHSVTDLQTPLGSVQRWDFCFLIRVFQIGTQSYTHLNTHLKRECGRCWIWIFLEILDCSRKKIKPDDSGYRFVSPFQNQRGTDAHSTCVLRAALSNATTAVLDLTHGQTHIASQLKPHCILRARKAGETGMPHQVTARV